MRLVLLGGLSTLLAGLVALGGVLISERRARPVIREEIQPDDPEPLPPARTATPARRLPEVAVPFCTPKPGWACWRGRLRLPDVVRTTWIAARSEDGDDSTEDDEEDNGGNDDEGSSGGGEESSGGGGNDDEASSGAGSDCEGRGGGSSDDNDPCDDEGNGECSTVVKDDESKPTCAAVAVLPVLPPLGSFVPFFRVRAVPWSDQPGVNGEQSGDTPALEEIAARLDPDGTFVLDVPPGSYDVEVSSKDDHLIAGIDGLVARAGDARDHLDVTLAAPVRISGRVVDDAGIRDQSVVEVHRVHRDDEIVLSTDSFGRFAVNGLRPGPYVLVADWAGVPGEAVQVQAPLDGIALSVTHLPTAMILVAPDRDGGNGRCPTGKLTLTNQDRRHERRGIGLQGCQALVPGVRPGSTWRAVGRAGNRVFDRVISFGFGKPIAPVCLDDLCRTDEAAVDIRVVDAGEDLVATAGIEVLANGREGSLERRTIRRLAPGFRAGGPLTLQSTAGTLQTTVTVWLMTGVNEVVIRLPGLVAEDQ